MGINEIFNHDLSNRVKNFFSNNEKMELSEEASEKLQKEIIEKAESEWERSYKMSVKNSIIKPH